MLVLFFVFVFPAHFREEGLYTHNAARTTTLKWSFDLCGELYQEDVLKKGSPQKFIGNHALGKCIPESFLRYPHGKVKNWDI